jgi:hypothetical protein
VLLDVLRGLAILGILFINISACAGWVFLDPQRAAACSNTFLGALCPGPKRTRIGANRMELEHRVVEFAGRRRRFIKSIEIAQVLPSPPDVAGIVAVFRHLVAGDDGCRLQSREFVERGDPFESALRVSLGKIRVNSVVDDIPRNDQPLRRNVQAGGASGVGPSSIDGHELAPFQFQFVAIERLGHPLVLGNLAWKEFAPEAVQQLRCELCAHRLHDLGCCERLRTRKAFQ